MHEISPHLALLFIFKTNIFFFYAICSADLLRHRSLLAKQDQLTANLLLPDP